MNNAKLNPYWFISKEGNITLFLATVYGGTSHIRIEEDAFLIDEHKSWEKLPENWINV